MRRELVRASRFLSLVLRHHPERIGLELDANGWAPVTELLRLLGEAGQPLTEATLHEIVATNDKQRFTFDDDRSRIRASQGHSIAVDLELTALEPPAQLFHGTADRNLDSIRQNGLRRGQRKHVHLSPDEATAIDVGRRYGRPVVLIVDAVAMSRNGFVFYRSANGVWLTDVVPPDYLHERESDR